MNTKKPRIMLPEVDSIKQIEKVKPGMWQYVGHRILACIEKVGKSAFVAVLCGKPYSRVPNVLARGGGSSKLEALRDAFNRARELHSYVS